MKPLVSVLMPSRDRAQLAKESIESLGSGNFEVLMYVDSDDPQLESYKQLPAKLIVGRRMGYKGFHGMINTLAKEAKGKWLLLWNDDALMDNPDWVDVIKEKAEYGITVLNISAPGVDNSNLFPVISRELYEIIGHYSLSTHCDSWVQDLANELGIHQSINGLHVTHRRDVINDQTKSETQGVYATSSPEYSSLEMQRLLKIDIEKVRKRL